MDRKSATEFPQHCRARLIILITQQKGKRGISLIESDGGKRRKRKKKETGEGARSSLLVVGGEAFLGTSLLLLTDGRHLHANPAQAAPPLEEGPALRRIRRFTRQRRRVDR